MKIGDSVLYNGRPGRVTATSGMDKECIVRFMDENGGSTSWISQDHVLVLAPEPEPCADAIF